MQKGVTVQKRRVVVSRQVGIKENSPKGAFRSPSKNIVATGSGIWARAGAARCRKGDSCVFEEKERDPHSQGKSVDNPADFLEAHEPCEPVVTD